MISYLSSPSSFQQCIRCRHILRGTSINPSIVWPYQLIIVQLNFSMTMWYILWDRWWLITLWYLITFSYADENVYKSLNLCTYVRQLTPSLWLTIIVNRITLLHVISITVKAWIFQWAYNCAAVKFKAPLGSPFMIVWFNSTVPCSIKLKWLPADCATKRIIEHQNLGGPAIGSLSTSSDRSTNSN